MTNIIGTSASETLTGTGGDDLIQGLGGDDRLNGGDGDDRLEGGDGDDTLDGGAGSDIVFGGAGNDRLTEQTGGGSDSLYGEEGDDVIFLSRAGGGTALLDGGAGNDRFTIQQYGGSVTALGGEGNDTFELLTQATIGTGTGRDVILFNASYELNGTPITVLDFETGSDGDRLDLGTLLSRTAWSGSSNPFASGHARLVQVGPDTLLQIDGNGGGDAYVTAVTFNNTDASNFLADNLGYPPDGSPVVGVSITGTSGSDILTGSVGNDLIQGLSGNDTLNGDAGDDQLEGGDGNDRLNGGAGADVLLGGDGDDTINGEAGINVGWGGAGNDRLVAVTNGGSDSLYGEEGDDTFFVSRVEGGTLLLDGGSGNDRFTIQQYSGSVTALGGEGNDTFELLTRATIGTGTGQDVIQFHSSYELNGAPLTVLDFETGAGGDRIDLNSLLNKTAWDGSSNPFASGHVRLVQQGPDTLLQIDSNGGGNSYVTVATLQNASSSSFTAENVGFPIQPGPVSAVVNRPVALTEGATAEPLSITFLNVSNLSTTIVVTMSGTSTVTGEEVSVQLGAYAINVNQAPARDYTYSLGDISILDDLVIEGLENVTLSITASGQTFAGGGNSETVVVSVLDNDFQGTAGHDVLTGDNGANLLVGMNGDDTLTGQAGNDVLLGGFGSDHLDGGSGDDILEGGRGNDQIDGGAGADTLLLSGRPTDYFVSRAANGFTISRPGDRDTVQSIETVSFDGGATVLTMAEFERQAFDPRAYLEANRDVYAAFGPNLVAAEEHYFSTGVGEGRSAGSFDVNLYIASNSDLLAAFGTNQDGALEHYINTGSAEGRSTDGFDQNGYLASNPDLLAVFGNDVDRATEHYIGYGAAEGRSVDRFDARLYTASNPDLARQFGEDSRSALLHYVDQGYAEGRPTTGFNGLLYLASNPDLAAAFGANGDLALVHYLSTGAQENRATTGFDPLIYAASSTDLAAAFGTDTTAALTHYLTTGIQEGRPTAGFDPLVYALSYPDLAAAFGNDAAAALNHYLTTGVHEGRRPTGPGSESNPSRSWVLDEDAGADLFIDLTRDGQEQGWSSENDATPLVLPPASDLSEISVPGFGFRHEDRSWNLPDGEWSEAPPLFPRDSSDWL